MDQCHRLCFLIAVLVFKPSEFWAQTVVERM